MSVAKKETPGIIRAFNMGDTATSRESSQTNAEIYDALVEFRDCREVSYHRIAHKINYLIVQYSTLHNADTLPHYSFDYIFILSHYFSYTFV